MTRDDPIPTPLPAALAGGLAATAIALLQQEALRSAPGSVTTSPASTGGPVGATVTLTLLARTAGRPAALTSRQPNLPQRPQPTRRSAGVSPGAHLGAGAFHPPHHLSHTSNLRPALPPAAGPAP